MASKKLSMRLQTPPDKNGNRTDIHVVTSSDEVIVNPSSSNPETLTNTINHMGIKIQSTKPEYACIWAKPV